ncbi:MAG: FAD-dependent oxidoreductase [Anaerolineae bacterium]|nr:FAD-dependent oxidoreductase [Anaerolineae bacterium]MCA9907949.1 FAD-dependent oxidoreductase [Anaerolineae bacterium]
MPDRVLTDVLIVGAGLSGLMAAHVLNGAGVSVVVVDKGKQVGGRLATYTVGAGLADLGAQFFTARDPEFQTHVDSWIADELAFIWSRGWSDGSVSDNPRDGHARYAIRGGLTRLAQHLAQDLDCRLETPIEKLSFDGERCTAHAIDGILYEAKQILLTPPVPESLALLAAGNVQLVPAEDELLREIDYQPCLCVVFRIDGDIYLPEPGALQRAYADIAWIADNWRKGISPDARTITVQASSGYSHEHFEDSDEAIISRFTAELVAFMNPNAHVREVQIKRWRYAQPMKLYPHRFLAATGLPLVFAGDAFAGPRIEGAALSGLAAARALLAK